MTLFLRFVEIFCNQNSPHLLKTYQTQSSIVEQSLNHYMLFHFQNRLLPNYTLYKHLFLRTLEGSKLSFQFPLYGREQLLLDATISKKRYG